MNDIAILGSEGLAKEIYGIIKSTNAFKPSWNFLGFISKAKPKKPIIDEFLVIGDDNYIVDYERKINLVIGIADPKIRQNLFNQFKTKENVLFPNIFHPSSIGDLSNIQLGFGNIIAANCIISPHVSIGNFNILNMNTIIAHDSRIHNFCTINPNSNISGNVKINNGCLVGSNSVIYQGVSLGVNTILGIGSVLTRNTQPHTTYFGNPAKKIG